MVNFIVVDDEKEIVSKVESIINEVMMKNNLDYRVQTFLEYDDEFDKVMEDNSKIKIYFLDIDVKDKSGIDIARNIRNSDLDSVIIFLTLYQDLASMIVEDTIMALTYINKYNDSYNKIVKAIKKALKVIGRKKIIRFTEKGVTITIPTNEILYVTRDTIERKSVIVTEYNRFKTNKTLIELFEMLGEPFIESHRACLVNKDRIRTLDKRKRKITFDNEMSIDLVSPNFKLEVSNNVRNI